MSVFREMRRKDKQVTIQEAFSILEKAPYITLSTVLENSYPYAVPLHHVLIGNCVYFHCAPEGQKCDAFKMEERVCLSAVESFKVVPQKFTTNYRSASVFGRIALVNDNEEKRAALKEIIRKFSPSFIESGDAYIDRFFEKTAIYRVDIEHITGKVSEK